MRPFCVKCCREMYPTKNDRAVEIRGQIYFGDEYACDNCCGKIVTGFGRAAASDWWPEQYAVIRKEQESRGNLLVEVRA